MALENPEQIKTLTIQNAIRHSEGLSHSWKVVQYYVAVPASADTLVQWHRLVAASPMAESVGLR
jgi:hypothetical protein